MRCYIITSMIQAKLNHILVLCRNRIFWRCPAAKNKLPMTVRTVSAKAKCSIQSPKNKHKIPIKPKISDLSWPCSRKPLSKAYKLVGMANIRITGWNHSELPSATAIKGSAKIIIGNTRQWIRQSSDALIAKPSSHFPCI